MVSVTSVVILFGCGSAALRYVCRRGWYRQACLCHIDQNSQGWDAEAAERAVPSVHASQSANDSRETRLNSRVL